MHAVSVDVDDLEQTYDEWLLKTEIALADLRERGFFVQKIEIDIEEFVKWCKSRQLPIDDAARSAYAAEKLNLQGDTQELYIAVPGNQLVYLA